MTMLAQRRKRPFDSLCPLLGGHVHDGLLYSSLAARLLYLEHVRIRPGSHVYDKGACNLLFSRGAPTNAADGSCYSTASQEKHRRVPLRTTSIRWDGKLVNHQASGNRPPRPAAQTRLGQAPSLAGRPLSALEHFVVRKAYAATRAMRAAVIHSQYLGFHTANKEEDR